MRFLFGLFSLLVCSVGMACNESSITKPSPFMGNNDEIFVLSDGSVWQVKYEYEYLYAYSPSVVICPDKGILVIDGKKLNVVQVAGASRSSSVATKTAREVIESRIEGDSEGWDGESIFQLTNGQIWQQTEYYYKYKYKYRPNVLIFKTPSGYKMQIEGIEKAVGVEQIN